MTVTAIGSWFGSGGSNSSNNNNLSVSKAAAATVLVTSFVAGAVVGPFVVPPVQASVNAGAVRIVSWWKGNPSTDNKDTTAGVNKAQRTWLGMLATALTLGLYKG